MFLLKSELIKIVTFSNFHLQCYFHASTLLGYNFIN